MSSIEIFSYQTTSKIVVYGQYHSKVIFVQMLYILLLRSRVKVSPCISHLSQRGTCCFVFSHTDRYRGGHFSFLLPCTGGWKSTT